MTVEAAHRTIAEQFAAFHAANPWVLYARKKDT